MNILKEHMLTIFKENLRLDGRKFDEYRKVSVEYGISNSAEGSARVKIGDTEVVVGVKMELGEPYPDSQDEGSFMVNVELRPFASPDFTSGPPSIDAIELARVTDRAIREAEALNFKKLCIKEGEKMWIVVIDVYPINDAGNLFDAVGLGALAALKDTVFPKLENDKINYKEKTNKKLPLESEPLSCTVYKIGTNFLVDLTNTEEKFFDARLTVGVTDNGNLCSMQKGGDTALSLEDINQMVDLAIKKAKELRKVLK